MKNYKNNYRRNRYKNHTDRNYQKNGNGSALINDLNNVKVSVDNNNYALNFSRKPIYSISDLDKNIFYKHIGVYGYRKLALINLSKLPQTELELFEKIEALRIIESGDKIKMAEVLTESVGIDTKEDLEKAIDIWKNK